MLRRRRLSSPLFPSKNSLFYDTITYLLKHDKAAVAMQHSYEDNSIHAVGSAEDRRDQQESHDRFGTLLLRDYIGCCSPTHQRIKRMSAIRLHPGLPKRIYSVHTLRHSLHVILTHAWACKAYSAPSGFHPGRFPPPSCTLLLELLFRCALVPFR